MTKAIRREVQAALAITPGLAPSAGIDGVLELSALTTLKDIALVVLWSAENAQMQRARQALAERTGPVGALAGGDDLARLCRVERHVCIDTTASGCNADLLAAMAE